MSVGSLQTMSIAFFVLSGILLALAVFLYFRLEIKATVDDLSGKMAARQIRELREKNIQPVEYVSSRDLFDEEVTEATAKLTAEPPQEDKTMLLDNVDKKAWEEETSLLTNEKNSTWGKYKVIKNEMEIHTEERI